MSKPVVEPRVDPRHPRRAGRLEDGGGPLDRRGHLGARRCRRRRPPPPAHRGGRPRPTAAAGPATTPPSRQSGPAITAEGPLEVVDGPGQRTDLGAAVAQRADPREVARGRHEAGGRLEAEDAAPRGREPDAAARVAPDARAATRRSPRRTASPLLDPPTERAGSSGWVTRGPGAPRTGLGDDHRAGPPQPGDDRARPRSGRRSGDRPPSPAHAKPSTSIQSFTVIGSPWSGPTGPVAANASSSRAASASARSSSKAATAFVSASTRRSSSRHAVTASTAETAPSRRSSRPAWARHGPAVFTVRGRAIIGLHARRVVGHRHLLDPVGGDQRRDPNALRPEGGALRRPAAGSHRPGAPHRPARRRRVPLRQPPGRHDGGGGRSHHQLQPAGQRRAQQHPHAGGGVRPHLPGPRVPRPPAGAGRHADLGDLLADRGWTARHACAASRPAREVRRSWRRRSGRPSGSRCTPTGAPRPSWSGARPSPATGCTATTASSCRRPPPSRSRSGTSAARAPSARRGARRTRRCS